MKELSAAVPAHLMRQPSEVRNKNVLGKDDFLKLLMTQLKHQDPLNPTDHEQFAAQLAQFSSLEHLSNIGKGIDKMQAGMSAEEKLQALNMIGKEVRSSGSKVDLQQGQEVSLKYLPDPEVQPLKASIYTRGGQLVRELNLTAKDNSQIHWDGNDQEGNPLPTGNYMFRVFGVGEKGQAKEMNTELGGKVVGVDVMGKSPVLVVKTETGNTRIELSQITKVTMGGVASPPNKTSVKSQMGSRPEEVTKQTVTSDQAEDPTRIASAQDLKGWRDFVEANSLGGYRR